MDRDCCGLKITCKDDGCENECFCLGHQYDSGDYFCILANTEFGVIPGKAQRGGGECWFPYGGEEHQCEDFEWLASDGHSVLLRPSDGGPPPETALALGSQEDGTYYVAVAHTDEGDVPGKAKEGEAWYPFGGEERSTDNFSWVIARPGKLGDGQVIHLEHQHGGNVRVNEDGGVDGKGGNGEWASFTVQRGHNNTIKLQNIHWPQRFIAVRKSGLTTGSGGQYCRFRTVHHKDGTVSLQSVNFPGRHVGIEEDHEPRDPKQTGTGINSRFNIINCE